MCEAGLEIGQFNQLVHLIVLVFIFAIIIFIVFISIKKVFSVEICEVFHFFGRVLCANIEEILLSQVGMLCKSTFGEETQPVIEVILLEFAFTRE